MSEIELPQNLSKSDYLVTLLEQNDVNVTLLSTLYYYGYYFYIILDMSN